MRKLVVLIGMLLLVLAGVHRCQAKPVISGRVTVTYVNLAGGFEGIISEKSYNGTRYFDPVFFAISISQGWITSVVYRYSTAVHTEYSDVG